jgi:hypothetical protein
MGDVPRRHGQVAKKPLCISRYNMFMNGIAGADRYLTYYSLLRKTLKWTKKAALWLTNCALFNSSLVYKKLNPARNLRYKEFLLQVAKARAADKMAMSEPDSDTDIICPGSSHAIPHRPREDPPGRLLGDMRRHFLEEIVQFGEGKKKSPCRRCRICDAHNKRNECRYICNFCLVPLHRGECFQRYHILKYY